MRGLGFGLCGAAIAAGSGGGSDNGGKVGRGRKRNVMHQKPGNALNSPPKASYLGADLVAALPGLDVDDLAHGEVLLVGVAKSSLGERERLRGGVLLAGHEIELE